MNKLVKKSNRRNLKSTKKSNRKLNKKSNRKNLRNSKLNKKSNRKNLNKKGGVVWGDPDLGKNEGYDCLCIKNGKDTNGTLIYANNFQSGGSRKSLSKNKSNKKSNQKKKLNKKGGDLKRKQLQFCECKSHDAVPIRTTKLGEKVGNFFKGKNINKCNCIPFSNKSDFNQYKDKINNLFKAYSEITKEQAPGTGASPPGTSRPLSTSPVARTGSSSLPPPQSVVVPAAGTVAPGTGNGESVTSRTNTDYEDLVGKDLLNKLVNEGYKNLEAFFKTQEEINSLEQTDDVNEFSYLDKEGKKKIINLNIDQPNEIISKYEGEEKLYYYNYSTDNKWQLI